MPSHKIPGGVAFQNLPWAHVHVMGAP
jgi:hypothetical protein